MLEGTPREQFEALHAAGMASKNTHDYEQALVSFEAADRLALANDDNRKRLDALQLTSLKTSILLTNRAL